ncbi:MAG: BACON domain-containing protein, partial [Opitutales bacterium]|nr:BACON domain-containing protein [Opitutales bacterium]
GGELGSGGGIYNSGTLTLTNCTVSGNEATGNEATGNEGVGGGIFNPYGTLTLIRNIVSGNSALNGSEIFSDGEYGENGGTIDADEYNVFGHSGLTTAQAFVAFAPGATDVTCSSDGTIPTVIASILNTTLADNGGPTLTHALVANSPAIDLASTGPDTDQRGIARPQGSGVDAGAYEYASDPSMSVSLATLDVAAASESHALTVTSNVVWTAATAAEWLTITPISGIGNGSVNVTASANTGLARDGIITFSATGVTPVTVTVTQAAGSVPPNTAPRFQNIGNKTVKAGQSITFQVIADDEDDNVLQYSATHP